MAFDLVVRGDLVLGDRVLEGGWVGVAGGVIQAIGQGAPPAAADVADHRGMLVFPGLVDGHMHTSSALGWPGIEGASRTAAAGGVTTCVDMPYDVPRPVTDAKILAEKIQVVNATSHVDMALYGTIRKDGGVEEIAGLAAAGVCSFKLSTYEYDAVRFPRIDHTTMEAAFREIAKTGLMVGIHNEDQEIVEGAIAAAKATGRTDPIMHARTRPPLCETMADLAIFEMALETGAHVHIAHSSLARGFDLAEMFRRQGAKTSGEACIQYLCMTEEDLVGLQGFGKCNPPFRTADEVERVWQSLAEGKIAYVSTDHAPWPRAKKEYHGDIFACGAGLRGCRASRR
ncbi:MAG: allantoinase [Rubritepida sp.]|nr:allantoinase [Rubritepida sp.]